MHRHRPLRDVHRSERVCWIWCECFFQVNPTPAVYLLALYFVHSLVMACPDLCTCPDNSSNQVTCTSAGLTEIPRNLPPSLMTLDLSKNQIHTLTESSLTALRSVVNLQLKENQIEAIHNGAFQPVESLQTLDLSNNKLTELSQFTFQGATGLLHLDISANQLEKIDDAFSGMTQLSRLDLNNNNINEITQYTLHDLTNLRYLLLAENRISQIDRKAFKNLEKLTYLVLKGNPISQVTRFQFNSYHLSYVDLSQCELSHVPRGLPNSIRYLQLRRNNITVIRRHTFQDCPFVSILVLDENGITEIGERTFEQMTYLQQLWLNSNKLRRIPHHLPVSLQRLLVDLNSVEYVNDAFPPGSQLNTLSLMGNNITYLSYSALYNIPKLVSIDLSNNHIEHLYGNTFVKSTHLETLQLSKNPLQYFHSRCLHGLSFLQTLSLAYIPTVVSMHPDSFQDLTTLTKLDLDSSHWILQNILTKQPLLSSLRVVEDLSMLSSDLTTLQEDFTENFPKLKVFHISSTRWHCDRSLIWLRNWLLTTEVHVENKDDISCFTPHDLYGRSLTSLNDYEFVATTTLKFSTALPTAPGKLSTFPSTLSTSSTTPSSPSSTATPPSDQNQTEGVTESEEYEEYYEGEEDKGNTEDVIDPNEPIEPFDLDSWYQNVNTGDSKPVSSRYPTWEEIMNRKSTTQPGEFLSTDQMEETNYDPNGVKDGNLQILPLPEVEIEKTTKLPNASQNKTDYEGPKKSTVVIIIATTIATVIVAGVLIFVIVYLSRKHRDKKKPKPKPKANVPKKRKKRENQNGIKYKSRNDVLYFMPKSTDGSTSESLQTNTSKEAMTLIPGRDINHEGPLRVYKWEDF